MIQTQNRPLIFSSWLKGESRWTGPCQTSHVGWGWASISQLSGWFELRPGWFGVLALQSSKFVSFHWLSWYHLMAEWIAIFILIFDLQKDKACATSTASSSSTLSLAGLHFQPFSGINLLSSGRCFFVTLSIPFLPLILANFHCILDWWTHGYPIDCLILGHGWALLASLWWRWLGFPYT